MKENNFCVNVFIPFPFCDFTVNLYISTHFPFSNSRFIKNQFIIRLPIAIKACLPIFQTFIHRLKSDFVTFPANTVSINNFIFPTYVANPIRYTLTPRNILPIRFSLKSYFRQTFSTFCFAGNSGTMFAICAYTLLFEPVIPIKIACFHLFKILLTFLLIDNFFLIGTFQAHNLMRLCSIFMTANANFKRFIKIVFFFSFSHFQKEQKRFYVRTSSAPFYFL